jgi:hypothetical protein
MRRATLLSSAVALLLLSTSAYAQAKPSFAGKWTILPDSAASAAAQQQGMPRGGASMGGLGEGATIAQDDKTISVTRAGPSGAPLTTVFNLDGTETRQSLDIGNGNVIDLTLKGRWNDKQFVTSTIANVQGSPFEIILSFSLDDKGNLVTEHTTPPMGNGIPGGTMVTKYKKGS